MILVIPFCKKDCKSAWQNITWSHELDGKLPFRVLLAYDSDIPKRELARIKAVSKHAFESVLDFRYPKWEGDPRWPNPQNYAFQTIAWEMINKFKEPFLFWEPDAVPIRKRWAHDIWDTYQSCGQPFMGHIVHGAFEPKLLHLNGVTAYPPEPHVPSKHLNGVAVYPPDLHTYSTAMMIPPVGLAWDVAGADGCVQNAHHSDLITNVWEIDGWNKIVDSGGIVPSFPTQQVVDDVVDFSAALFHRTKDCSLVQRLRERVSGTVARKPLRAKKRRKPTR